MKALICVLMGSAVLIISIFSLGQSLFGFQYATYNSTISQLGFSYFPDATVEENLDSSSSSITITFNVQQPSRMTIVTYHLNESSIEDDCKCHTVKEFARWEYIKTHTSFDSKCEDIYSLCFSPDNAISDNPTKFLNSIPAWEMEYNTTVGDMGYKLWFLRNNDGYAIDFISKKEDYRHNLDIIKHTINSISFPVGYRILGSQDLPTDRLASFLVGNTTNKANVSVISSGWYHDTVNPHFVGEVKNFGNQTVSLVEVRGIFNYNLRNIGGLSGIYNSTSMSFAKPMNIPPQNKSQFDLSIFTESPITVSQIRDYEIKLNWR